MARFLVIAVVIGVGVVVRAPAASAADCHYVGPIAFCGEVYNDSSLWIAVTGTPGGWCWTDNAPRYGTDPMNGVCSPPSGIKILAAGGYSGDIEADTDAFRSDAGCVTKYQVLGGGALLSHAAATRIDDRRGKSQHKWIKLSDTNEVDIIYQACGSAMTSHYVNTWHDAQGFQDQWCASDGTGAGGQRCAADGTLYAASNYFCCKVSGGRVSGSNGTYNDWWLLTDLDYVAPGRDGRSFVSAYYLSGGPNDTQNNRAAYWNGSAWVDFPNC